MRVEPPGTSATSGTGSQLAQLLPPPMPSAAILNPLAAVCDKPHADEAADSKEKRTTLKRQHSFSGSSVDMEADDGERRKENTWLVATFFRQRRCFASQEATRLRSKGRCIMERNGEMQTMREQKDNGSSPLLNIDDAIR